MILSLAACSTAQFIAPGNDAGLQVFRSQNPDSNWTISYKEPSGICQTALETQKQYTGWVDVPGDHPANLFFWFVEAREPTDDLTIWLNGGPGSTSLFGFFTGLGPCEVFETGMDEFKTLPRQWGWDRASNMLFIDQVCI